VCFADERQRERLCGRLGLLADPAAAGWEQVKRNASRTVWRGRLDGRTLYLKQFHPRAWYHRLAERLGVSGAMRELRAGRYLAGRGVDVPRYLAASCGSGGHWSLSEAVEPAEPADRWHVRQLARGRAGRLAIRVASLKLAELLGRMHAAGIVHADLHAGNILVAGSEDDPRPVLMDLHRIRRIAGHGRRARSANLAQLLYDRRPFTTRTERLRFLRRYLRVSGGRGTLRGWQRQIEHLTAWHTRAQLRAKDRRIRGNNRYFRRLKLPGGWRGHVILASKRQPPYSRAAQMSFSADAWRQVLSNPAALLGGEAGEVEIRKDSASGRVARRRLRVGECEVDVFIKHPRRKRPWKALVDCLRPSRSVRAFCLGHELLARRIDTALPLAALERRRGPWLCESVLITEAVDAPSLDGFLRTWLGSPPTGDRRLGPEQQRQLARQVLWQLGRLVQRLHDHGMSHRDMKASNLLVQWEPHNEARLVLIDLDGLTRRFVGARRRFQTLMRLNVSLLQRPEVNHAGRLRMLLGYLRRPGSGRIEFKPYWRYLERWSAQKIDRQIRDRRRRQKQQRRPQA
jgi:tRNA A-37 threonylcarbamoyl transferase component Bud32